MSCSYYNKHVIDCKICMIHLWYPLISRMVELMNNILIHNYTFTSANMQIYKNFSRIYAQAVDLLSKCCVYMNFINFIKVIFGILLMNLLAAISDIIH